MVLLRGFVPIPIIIILATIFLGTTAVVVNRKLHSPEQTTNSSRNLSSRFGDLLQNDQGPTNSQVTESPTPSPEQDQPPPKFSATPTPSPKAMSTPTMAPAPYSPKHIQLSLLPKHQGLLKNPDQWLAKLDDAYEAMTDLIGRAPYGGGQITIKEVDDYPGGAAVAGNPILWHSPGVPEAFERINNHNELSYGPIHELGHDFDLPEIANYYMGGSVINGEQWANLKVVYVDDTLAGRYPTATFYRESIGYYKLGELGQKYFYERFALPWVNSGRKDWQNMHHDVYTGLLYWLKGQIGWEPFKKTFRDYLNMSSSSPSGDLAKIELFAHLLSKHAGRDLTGHFRDWGLAISSP